MCDHPIVGLVAALLVEARHWTKLRWEFDEASFLRAWHLSIVLILFGAVSVWLDGPTSPRIYSLFAWLPVLLLPVQFVQAFGTRGSVPVHMFSILAHSRIKRQRSLGQAVHIPEINFGYVTIAVALLGASLGRNADGWLFLPGALGITAWALRSVPAGRSPLGPWLISLLMIGAVGVGGHLGMRQLTDWIANGMGGVGGDGGGDVNSMRSRIALGGLRDHKNSSRIFWRLRDNTGGTPVLLRTASYNAYLGGTWLFRPRPDTPIFESLSIVSDRQNNIYRIASNDPEVIRNPAPDTLPSFDLLGAVRKNSLLPMPPGTRSLRDPAADNLEINTLGTMRIEPKFGVIDSRVTWGDRRNLETPPWTDDDPPDLRIPRNESAALQQIVAELGLDQGSLREKTSRLQLFFLRHFEYARYLELEPSDAAARFRHRNNAVSQFLLKTRRGHCEYFATATTLLLRQAGIPARYTIGFASVEHGADPTEIVLRGSHAHAWCRAWDADSETWVDVDLTPPDWSAREGASLGTWQAVIDWWQRLREDLLAWRTRPGNAGRLNAAMVILGVLVATYVIIRLWQSRRPDDRPAGVRHEPSTLPAPLRPLARNARQRIGPRPPGTPFGHWLRQLEESLGSTPELDQLIDLHARLRFDPAGPGPQDESRLADLAATLLRRLRQQPRPAPHIVR